MMIVLMICLSVSPLISNKLTTNAAVQVQYLSFDEQISSFEIVKKAMIAKIGKEAAEAAVNAALFQIGLGEGLVSSS